MEQLESLLDAAAEALIAGNFAALAQLSPQIEALDLSEFDRKTARSVQAKAQRNTRLLEAATRGVKAAKARVAEITRGPTLTTYDARGQKAQIVSGGPETARRV